MILSFKILYMYLNCVYTSTCTYMHVCLQYLLCMNIDCKLSLSLSFSLFQPPPPSVLPSLPFSLSLSLSVSPFYSQASKAEITFLKYFGVVSPKAGRTLVYKMSDVAKMYQHWNIAIPDFVKEICDGKASSTYHEVLQVEIS